MRVRHTLTTIIMRTITIVTTMNMITGTVTNRVVTLATIMSTATAMITRTHTIITIIATAQVTICISGRVRRAPTCPA